MIFWPRNDLVPLLRWRRHCSSASWNPSFLFYACKTCRMFLASERGVAWPNALPLKILLNTITVISTKNSGNSFRPESSLPIFRLTYFTYLTKARSVWNWVKYQKWQESAQYLSTTNNEVVLATVYIQLQSAYKQHDWKNKASARRCVHTGTVNDRVRRDVSSVCLHRPQSFHAVVVDERLNSIHRALLNHLHTT